MSTWLHTLLALPGARSLRGDLPVEQRAFGLLLDASLTEYHHLRGTEGEGAGLPAVGSAAEPFGDGPPELVLVHSLLRYIRGVPGAADGFAAAARDADRQDVQVTAALLAAVVHREYGLLDDAERVVQLALEATATRGADHGAPEWLPPASEALLNLQRSAIMAEGGRWAAAEESGRRALAGLTGRTGQVPEILRAVAASNVHVFARHASPDAVPFEPPPGTLPAAPDGDLLRGLSLSQDQAFGWSLGDGRRAPDYQAQQALWRGLVRRECLGDYRAAQQLREALGRQQLVDAVGDGSDPGRDPFLLLVRSRGSEKDLARAVRHFLRGGPTGGLQNAVSAATSAGWRSEQHHRGVLELLAAAGDLLDEAAADRVAERLLDDAGGRAHVRDRGYDLPYYSLRALPRVLAAASPDVHRRTAAWALRRLDEPDEPLDDLVASELTSVLRGLDWSWLDAPASRSWQDFVERRLPSGKVDAAARALYGLARHQPDWARRTVVDAFRAAPDLRRGALALDVDDDLPSDVLETLREFARGATARRRESAAGGHHTFGTGPNEAVVLVAALLRQPDPTAWQLAADFVGDGHVLLTHKAPVVDWLVRHREEVPADVVTALREGLAEDLPGQDDAFMGEGEVEREALWLRLAFAHDIGRPADRLRRLARLAGGSDPSARREAAATLTATAQLAADLAPMVLTMAHDAVAEVRGAAAGALLRLAASDHDGGTVLPAVSQGRVRELLAESGLAAPLAVIRAVAAEPVGSSSRSFLADEVARVARGHVSAYVRRAARELTDAPA